MLDTAKDTHDSLHLKLTTLEEFTPITIIFTKDSIDLLNVLHNDESKLGFNGPSRYYL